MLGFNLHQIISDSKRHLCSWSYFAPLVAAVIAPVFTLMSIPAVTETWLTSNGVSIPDPTANLVLSSIELVFTVAANVTLILRFSVKNERWRVATTISLFCWFIKFIIAFVNVFLFGPRRINSLPHANASYGEGFWCAVLTLFSSGVILFLLLFHFAFGFQSAPSHPTAEQLNIRIAGRHFMLQNVFFVFLIGTLALFMSRLEHWSFLQGIYFSTLSFLTLGFGDFYPTKVATQIVLFPFLLVGIAQLANLIRITVSFFSERMEAHLYTRSRKREKKERTSRKRTDSNPDINDEIRVLYQLNRHRERYAVMEDLLFSITGFIIFWLPGALVFSQTESWTYGQGLYFSYVLFFAIGYGDLAPVTAAGRTILIVYALVAVPIMTSFAVETISKIFGKISESQLQSWKSDVGLNTNDMVYHVGKSKEPQKDFLEPSSIEQNCKGRALSIEERKRLKRIEAQHTILPHSKFVEAYHELIDLGISKQSRNSVEKAEIDQDRMLTEHLLELVIELERNARLLLIGHMKQGSNGQIILEADRNVQLSAVKNLAEEVEKNMGNNFHSDRLNELMKREYGNSDDVVLLNQNLEEKDTLQLIRNYRQNFAGILATGARLMKLKGEEQFLFERRIENVR